MELELQHTCLNGYQTALDRTITQEETLESIVPDACPDMMRIVDADGQVCLTSRELSMGSLRLTGTIRASVMYIPEGEEGPRHVDVRIPFISSVDDPAIHGGCWASVVPRLCGVDARAINPRKILTRAELAMDIRIYDAGENTACTGASCAQEDGGLQQRLEQQETYGVCAVTEKTFTFSDVLNFPSSKPNAQELLRSKLEPRNLEAKVIGGKLILKGEAELTILYRSQDNAVCTARFQLPYSQIMDVAGAGEECDVVTELAVSGLDCSLQPGDGDSLAVTLELLAQAAVWEKQSIVLLSDLYSTRSALEVEREEFTLTRLMGGDNRRESVRQFCECGIPAKTVIDCSLTVGRVTRMREEKGLSIRADTSVTVLFLSEDDALCSVTYPIQAASELAEPEECELLCRCRGTGELTAVPVTGGLEVRFDLEFSFLMTQTVQCPCVGSVRELPPPEGECVRPSVVLRVVGENEELWDIAKSCGSTIEDIVAANELEQESAPAGMLLLIPRRR